MPGSFRDVTEEPARQLEYEAVTGRRCDGVLILYTSKHGGRTSLTCRAAFTPKRSRKGRKGKRAYRVRTSPMRYRELANASVFQRGPRVTAGSKLGVIKTYNSLGNLSSTQNVLSTGTSPASQSLKRTWDVKNPGPPFRSGGPFCSLNYVLPHASVIGTTMSSTGNPAFSGLARDEYTGIVVDDGTWQNDSTSQYLFQGIPSLTGYDTKAWDTLKPRVAKASVAQFIYELKDLPGQLETTANAFYDTWKAHGGSRTTLFQHPKLVSENYLNHEFGWAPFIGDLWQLFWLYWDVNKYIAQVIDQNNTWMRRSRVLEETETITELFKGPGSATMPSSSDFRLSGILKDFSFNGVTTKGSCTIAEHKTVRVWAVGSFKYYRPEFDVSLVESNFPDSAWATVQRLMTIYGLRINPTVLWKITPWTWAVDWFTQVGKFIEHHDEFITDGIVSRYLYIMKSINRYVTKTSVMNAWSGPRTYQWVRTLETKQRKVADSPYGFDLTWNNLSLRQWAILGAIGITRDNLGFISRG